MSSGWSAHWRNSSDSRAQASGSMPRNAPQSNTQGSGICSVCEPRRATASVSSTSGQTQPISPVARAGSERSSAAASATSLGSENHCGADQPNCCAYSLASASNLAAWPMARYRSNSTSQVSACCARAPPGRVSCETDCSHCSKSALAKAITASSSSGSCTASLTSTANGWPKSAPLVSVVNVRGDSGETPGVITAGPAALAATPAAASGSGVVGASWRSVPRTSSEADKVGAPYIDGGGRRDDALKPPSPTICCSISSIFAFTPPSGCLAGAVSELRASESSMRELPASAARWSGDRPSRRTLRSMSNSRLRTKSLRRLRSIIALSSERSSSVSRVSGSCREFSSAQSVAGLATKRTTLRKKLSLSLGSDMKGRVSGGPLSRRTSSASARDAAGLRATV